MPSSEFQRRAEWIWRPRQLAGAAFAAASDRAAAEANRFVYFRRVIELGAAPSTAPCLVSADGRYQLFVNGHLIGRGPGRCSPSAQSLDDYDLAPFLEPGRNVIAALAHAYGRHTAWYELPLWDHRRVFGCGGFFLQGEVACGDSTQVLDSGADWRCLEATAWTRDVPSNSLGFMEHCDGRRLVVGWNETGFDDHDWPQAQVLRVPGRNFAGDVVPFARLVPRRIPPMRESLRDAPALIGRHEVAEVPADDLAEQIGREQLQPLSRCTADAGLARITTVDGHAVVAVFDFGEVVCGYIRLELDGPDGASVDVVHGEQLDDDGRVHIFGGIDGYDAVPAHRYILREGRQLWERFEWSGLRYLQLTLRNCTRPLAVHAATLRETGYPVEANGGFECSDPVLNRVWQAGAVTLRRCMHDGYVDCPSREQRQWMDGYLGARFNYVSFGDAALAAQMLRQIAQSQQPDGLTMMAAPGDFARAGFTNIPDFCLYWVRMLDDYVRYTGRRELACELFPDVQRALRWFEQLVDADGLLADVPHWVFIDWADLDKHGQVTALNAQFVAALRAAARLAATVELSNESRRLDALAMRISAAVNTLLWDEERGLYADARHAGGLSRRVSQHANAAVIACDVAPRSRWDGILDAIVDPDRLYLTRRSEREPPDSRFDEERNIVLAQPFFMHVLHAALRAAGHHERILDNIRQRWPGLLDGGTTLRETWQCDATTSLCHAWSATPTFDLSVGVLGVTPASAGFEHMRIAPAPAGLDWARGRHPSPHGPVGIDWRLEDGVFRLDVELPARCQAQCVSPPGMRWQRVDDSPATAKAATLRGGRHTLSAVAARKPPAPDPAVNQSAKPR